MNTVNKPRLAPVLYIPHGGGPLPLLGDPGHDHMVDFLQTIRHSLPHPSAIVLISAHWEEPQPTVTSGKNPPLIYDYFGFPPESYQIEYPAPGSPELAGEILSLLEDHQIEASADSGRGFDHGLFVPLKILYPEAGIPCVQISLVSDLDPSRHIRIGKALASLRKKNILIIGSGFSFHNNRAFFSSDLSQVKQKNSAFQSWLIDACTDQDISEQERENRLIHWSKAPYARFAHPREEHLLPLHVCYGMSQAPAKLVFDGEILGIKVPAFLW